MIKSDVIAHELRKLEDEYGRITPEAVVEAARSENHPLHSEFNWDDASAAHEHRVWQARQLIKIVRVPVNYETPEPKLCPLYIRDPDMPADQQGYRNVSMARSDEDFAHACLVDEMKRVRSQLARARAYQEYFNCADKLDEMDELAKEVIAMARTVHEGARA